MGYTSASGNRKQDLFGIVDLSQELIDSQLIKLIIFFLDHAPFGPWLTLLMVFFSFPLLPLNRFLLSLTFLFLPLNSALSPLCT